MLDSLDTLIAFVVIMLVVSMLITIAVQMVAAALNLRGLNLLKGLAQSIGAIAPKLDKQAMKLAGTILRGRMLSDSSFKHWPPLWRLTTAARADEIFDSIHRLATGQKKASPEIERAAQKLLAALGLSVTAITQAADSDANLGKKLADEIETLQDARLKKRLKAGIEDLTSKLHTYTDDVTTRVVSGASTIDHAYEKFQYWYEIAEERVQQWFTTHTRIITIVFAFVFALGLQLDTVEIFQAVSTNRTLRDQLVAQSKVIGSQAERVFAGSQNVLQDGYAAWLRQAPGKVQTALGSFAVQPNDTRESLTSRLLASLPGDENAKSKQLATLDGIIDKTATDTLKARAGDYSTVRADFDRTGFVLFPDYAGGGRWSHGWRQDFPRHWPGLFFSVGLLSLGAPFWYNNLKNLTSLRSTVAQNISAEKDQSQHAASVAAAPLSFAGAAPARKAPPTVR